MPPELPASLFLIALAIAATGVGLERWRIRHRRPQARTGALILWCVSFWLVSTAVQLSSVDFETRLAWNRAQYLGMVPIPVLWLYLAAQFTGYDRYFTRRRVLLISIVPGLDLLFMATDQYHGLFIARAWLEVTGSTTKLHTEFGPIFWIGLIYSYGLLLAATLLLLWMLIRRDGFRWQGRVMLIAAVLSIGASILDFSRPSSAPWGDVDLTPLVLAVTVPLFIAILVPLQRTDIVPVARGSVFQGMRDAVLVLDPENRVVDLNPAAQQLIRHELKQVRGKRVTQIEVPWLESPERLLRATSSSVVMRLGPDDQFRTLDVSASHLMDWHGKVMSQILVFRDISERVAAEDALRQSEEHFRALTENATDIFVIVSADGKIQYASPSLEREFGLGLDEILFQDAFEFVHPDDIGEVVSALAQTVQKPGTVVSVTVRFRRTGEWRIIECIANNLLHHPAVKGIVVNARDVTDRVQAEERVRESLAEKEVLLKEIHHRVKNNMQVIASLLNLQAGVIEDPLTLAQFQDSQNRIRSMALIHERLYRSDDLAHIDMGEYLSDLTGHLLQSYRAEGAGVRLAVEAKGILLDIDAAIPCGLVVNELVSNALKHAFPNGRGGTVGVEMRHADESQVQLVVWDDGVGLPADVDYRNTTSLGLQLVNNLSRQLGGTITMCPEAGTRFDIHFPEPG